MQGWKSKLISLAGKETLIKSVVQGIPTYLCPWVRPVWFGSNIQVLGNLGGNASTVKWA
ncbi:hypothetical protein RHGRI_015031 [Rhododendron griersonianum]|uniref:Uncharacterized protein n=1 Tax=Rhododendron griersonianum TaxID=479676 RepID=A0AAV6KBQ3_9ERIC|nr:hypothetical protein RHGRI_015031 [Rhododendron griersonianum]